MRVAPGLRSDYPLGGLSGYLPAPRERCRAGWEKRSPFSVGIKASHG